MAACCVQYAKEFAPPGLVISRKFRRRSFLGARPRASLQPSHSEELMQIIQNPMRMLRKMLVSALALPLLATANLVFAEDDDVEHHERESYAIGLWGDLPYSPEQALGVPSLISDMNSQRLAFTVHDGDLKAGGGLCDDTVYAQALAYFNALRAPAMFTPGDNDWTDCDRPAAGGYSARERLDLERKIFFGTPYSLGQRPMRQDVQTAALCLGVTGTPVPCVENRRWTVGGVTYVTLNVAGSCNNLCDTNPDPAEFAARNRANILWMKESFRLAKARKSAAVMLITQANPGWDQSDPTRAPVRDPRTLAQPVGQPDGYVDFLRALRDEVIAFRKPVAYVHGDSHYYRIDKPLLSALGQRLENFTRIETFGNNQANGLNDVQWLKVNVNPRSREVFSFQAQIVPANRVAVPAPAP
jgi:hypothetical protein